MTKKIKPKFVSMGIYSKNWYEKELALLRSYGFECYIKKIDKNTVEIFMR